MTYLIIFLLTLMISLIVTWILKRMGNAYKLFDIAPEDDVLKIHPNSISYLGGLAMLITMGFGLRWFVANYSASLGQILALLFASSTIFALGFWDDLRWKNISEPKPYRKFIGLIIFPLLSSAILFWGGFGLHFLN